MKKFIIFFAVFLFGSNLINVNFFPQKDKLDVLLSLDDKFNGKVLNVDKNQFLITNILSNREYEKKFNNFFIKDIQISPSNDGVLIKIDTNAYYSTSVALTPDGYGIRFRILNKNILKDKEMERSVFTTNNTQTSLDYFSYIISLAILIILAIILWIVRKKLSKNLPVKGSINILFQKPIDAKNRVALIEFNNRKYLVIVGNSNILLDIFDENMVNISTKEDFDTFLKSEIGEKLDNLQKYIKNAEKLKEFDERI